MNDVSKISGASPASPTSNRVWKPPRKQKPGERSAERGHEENSKKEEDGGQDAAQSKKMHVLEIEKIEDRDENNEPLSYGAGGLKKPRNHKVDLII